jgi:predicted nucleotidyltransferase
MRITETERRVLRDAAREAFGADSTIFLFGSRADDARRGGDIDLLVETGKNGHAAIFEAQLRFLARVKLALGEQKIDVLVDYPDRKNRPEILRIARAQGVQL